VHGTTAITAITAQNTVAVTRVAALEPELVVAQIEAVASDFAIGAVKIGMVGGAAVIEAVAAALDALPDGTPVVLDPVMIAESGARLLPTDAERALIGLLLPRATIVTPNVPEARVLAQADADLDGAPLPPRAGRGRERGRRHRRASRYRHRCPPDRRRHDRRDPGAAPSRRRRARLGCTHSSALGRPPGAGFGLIEAAHAARAIAAEAVRLGLRDLGAGAGPVNVLGVGHGDVQRRAGHRAARRRAAGGLSAGAPTFGRVARRGPFLLLSRRSSLAIIPVVRFLRMKPGHGEVLLAEGDVEVAAEEQLLLDEFRRQLDEGMWAAVPITGASGRREAQMVKAFEDVPRDADRVIFFPRAAGGR